MRTLICIECGTVFKAENQLRFCSDECRRITLKRQGESRRTLFCECRMCGVKFHPKNSHPHKYCSKECQRQFAAILRSEREAVRELQKIKDLRICFECGTKFSITNKMQVYCSGKCGYAGNKRGKREQYAGEYVPRTLVCKECGCKFVTVCGDTHSVYCSNKCHRKYEKRIENRRVKLIKRLNRFENATYERIYERDEGVCQICGKPVTVSKDEIRSVWAGTIDHIVPLSLNGRHCLDNCQLAHRGCNSLKQQAGNEYKIENIDALARYYGWEARN